MRLLVGFNEEDGDDGLEYGFAISQRISPMREPL